MRGRLLWLTLAIAGPAVATPLLSPELTTAFTQPFAVLRDDTASLQRGAQIYIHYCSGCHSLRYATYQNVLDYLDVPQTLQQQIATQDLMFDPQGDISKTLDTALSATQGQHWFGVVPPDLSTITLQKGPTWIYQFLRGFYADPSRPNGCNNVVSPDTAMPNILAVLRGEVEPRFNGQTMTRLVTTKAGSLTPLDFDRRMGDVVNFLNYVAEPWYETRIFYGIAFCTLLFLLACVCHVLFKKTIRNNL